MILVVGFDLTAAGDQALLDASEALEGDPASSLHVVHVIDQKGLDDTGALDAAGKKQRALERGYPLVWKRVKDLATRMPFGLPADTAVDIGFAAVHAVRVQETIAKHLLRVASDFDATAIVVGRQGRPGSVVEHLRSVGDLVDGERPDGATSLFLRAKNGVTSIPKSPLWSGEGAAEDH